MNKELAKGWLPEAEEIASKSPDPYKKVGIIAFDEDDNLVTFGFNHAGKTVGPDHPFWINRETRRPFMTHAEQDLVRTLRGRKPHSVVITLFPCTSCVSLLASIGVKEIYYKEVYDKDLLALAVAVHYEIKTYSI
jgi:deoxycytidylate deaminase